MTSKVVLAAIIIGSFVLGILEMTGTTHVIETIRCTRSGCGPV